MRPDEAAAHLGLSSTEIETLQRVVRDQPSRVAAFMLSYLEEECSEGRDRRVVIAQVAYLCIALHIPPGLLCETLDQAEASTAMALRQLYRDAYSSDEKLDREVPRFGFDGMTRWLVERTRSAALVISRLSRPQRSTFISL
jgi:hypothetical protein